VIQGDPSEDWMSSLEPTMEQPENNMFPSMGVHISAPQLSLQGIDTEELGMHVSHTRCRKASMDGTGRSNTTDSAVRLVVPSSSPASVLTYWSFAKFCLKNRKIVR
jgi:hypothetical protein